MVYIFMNKLNQKASNLRPWRVRLFREVNIMTCASQCYKSSRWHRFCRTIVRFVYCIDGFFSLKKKSSAVDIHKKIGTYTDLHSCTCRRENSNKTNKKNNKKSETKEKPKNNIVVTKKKNKTKKKNNLLLFVQRLSLIWLYCIELFIC